MDIEKIKSNVLSILIQLAREKGYITFDDILKNVDSASLPIDEVERLCELVISEGIIIRDSDEVTQVSVREIDSRKYDKSQLNYNAIYKRVLNIDQQLKLYIEQLMKIEPPQQGEEAYLIYHAKEDNQFARERLVTMFLKVALRIALWHHNNFGYTLDETIQDANVGLLLALEKITIDNNVRYSTYAPWWIRQYISRKTQGVSKTFYSVPAHMKEKLITVIKIKRTHDCPLCVKPGHCLNLLEYICSKLSVNIETASYYLDLILEPLNLNELVEEESKLLNDLGQAEETMLDELRLLELSEQVSHVLSLLKERERTVLELRYGLHDGEQKTLEEVGMVLGVTRERVRQIEKRALLKIKHSKSSMMLVELLE